MYKLYILYPRNLIIIKGSDFIIKNIIKKRNYIINSRYL